MTQRLGVCSMRQEPSEISVKFGLVSLKDRSNLIWGLFSESGAAADALTKEPIYNPVSPLILKLS